MKKFFILLLCVMLGLLTFTACEEDSSKKSPSSNPNVEEEWSPFF